MLKDELIKVWVMDDRFQVEEILPEKAARLADELAEKYRKKGAVERTVLQTKEFFARRVTAWLIDQECNDSNKRIFFEQYTDVARSIISEAEEAIKAERSRRLENLFIGVSGT